MTYKTFIDVSDYQPILKADDLRGHISALVVKACEVDDQSWGTGQAVDKFVQDGLADKVQLAYDLKIPCAVYIFDNPNYTSVNGGTWTNHQLHPNSGDPRILALRQALKSKTYHAICIDVERWWLRYNEYLAFLNKQITGDQVQKIPAQWIHDSAEDLYNRIREDQAAGLLRNVPIWFYSARWVVTGYSPQLDTLFANHIQWLADYSTNVYKQSIGKVITWEALQTIIDAQSFNPAWVGNKQAEMLQLTDAVIPPGIYEGTKAKPVDVDVFLVDDLLKVFAPGEWSGVTPPPVVIPPIVPPVDLTPILERLTALEADVSELNRWRKS